MQLLFMGPPGAGKGTQAKVVCERLKIPQVSTGEILRGAIKNGTQMGLKAKSFMDDGKLVPDEVVIGIVRDRLKEPDAQKGYLLDGFPRTTEQADALGQILGKGQGLDAAINITVPDEELVKRLLGRAQKENRPDDTEPVIKQRLVTYEKQTRPLIDYYRDKGILQEVDGRGSPEEITARILKALKQ